MKLSCLLLAFVIFALPACQIPEEEGVVPEERNYLGTVSVLRKGEHFDNDNIKVTYAPKGDEASITLHRIRFVPQMPVTIDVTVPGVRISESSDGAVLLSCDEAIPLALGGKYPRYKVTDFRGSIQSGQMSFSLNFGDYPTSFRGSLIQ